MIKSAKYKLQEEIKIGTPLSLSTKYLNNSVSILTEFGMLLVFTLWRKHVNDSDEEAFAHLNDCCYSLITRKRYTAAKNVLNFCLFKQSRACSENVYRMMAINLANACKNLKEDAECEKVLAKFDWSATKDDFQLCIAALRMDVERVVTLMPSVAASNAITSGAFREWAVLDWIRDDPRVQEAFGRVYGEPMRTEVSASESEVSSNTASDQPTETTEPLINTTRH